MEKDIKVGIVGAARRGGSFFAAFEHNPQTVITAICDIDSDGLQAAVTAHGIKQTHTDHEAMLDRAGIDAVVIGTDAIVEHIEPPIGIHESTDMTLVGLASQISIANGSVWTDVPDPTEW
jgi:hypothetical protein